MAAKIKLLVPGYFKWMSENKLKASSNVVLVRDDNKNIIVDTGNPVVEKDIVSELKKEGLSPSDIDVVVNTHSHSDHRGNNHLFKKATIYVYGSMIKGDVYEFFPIVRSVEISKNTRIVPAQGHTDEDIVLIADTDKGRYAIAGDLFKSEYADVEFCANEIKLKESQEKIQVLSDFIIPGHGPEFRSKS